MLCEHKENAYFDASKYKKKKTNVFPNPKNFQLSLGNNFFFLLYKNN